jgi:hypothetical protein
VIAQLTGEEVVDRGDELMMGADDCGSTSYQNRPVKAHQVVIAPLLGGDSDRQFTGEEVMDCNDDILLCAYDSL